MIIRYLYILLLFLIVQSGNSQESYTGKELQEFVNVYMSFKTEKKRNSEVDKKHFETYKVTPARYREIAKMAVSNKAPVLESNEKQLVSELKRQNELLAKKNEAILKQVCLKNNITYSKYSSILNQFQKDIRFQRSLKPHFDAYIKQMK